MNSKITFSSLKPIKALTAINNKFWIIILLLCFGLNWSNAQNSKWITKGDHSIAKNNYYKAKQCYDKAIKAGEDGAYFKMGVLLSEGPADLCDEEVAALCFFQAASQISIDKLRAMADRNSPDAQMLLGYCYQTGNVVHKDLSKAIELYKKAEEFNLVFLIDALQRQIDGKDEGQTPVTDFNEGTFFSDSIYHLPEEAMPEFPGGIDAFGQTLSKIVNYPQYALRNRISGVVLVKFVVEKDGSVDNAEIMASCFPVLDNEALRAMKYLPKWKPGMSQGKPVRCFFQVPITFRY